MTRIQPPLCTHTTIIILRKFKSAQVMRKYSLPSICYHTSIISIIKSDHHMTTGVPHPFFQINPPTLLKSKKDANQV